MIRIATETDLPIIRNLRREVYSNELNQYPKELSILPGNETGYYLIYLDNETSELCGFIYISFGNPYEFNRHIDFQPSQKSYEIGRLTVKKEKRYEGIGKKLFLASVRFCKTRNWSNIFYSLANNNYVNKYMEFGLKKVYVPDISLDKYLITSKCGDISYTLMYCMLNDLPDLDLSSDLTLFANHGGNFLDNIKELPTISNDNIVIADVLDAWYDPCFDTSILNSPFLVKTSPSSNCVQLINTIREKRNISMNNEIICGAGSSDLIYRALPNWLSTNSNVLILKPTYSEYPHIFKNVIGCNLTEYDVGYEQPDIKKLKELISNGNFNMVCIVNPNSPTGRWVDLFDIIRENQHIDFWIDETYTDLIGIDEKLECKYSKNLYVLKSMSKCYALSGIRVAYLVGPNNSKIDKVKLLTPPWVVSYIAQIAGILALTDENNYYPKMWELTRTLREEMCTELARTRNVIGGAGNFIVIKHDEPDKLRNVLREFGIYVRSFNKAIRIAVRSKRENDLVLFYMNKFRDI